METMQKMENKLVDMILSMKEMGFEDFALTNAVSTAIQIANNEVSK